VAGQDHVDVGHRACLAHRREIDLERVRALGRRLLFERRVEWARDQRVGGDVPDEVVGAENICKLLGDGPLTAFEIAHALWGNVAVTQAYLTLSEVLGHADLLVADGRVVEQSADGVTRFAAT
jgi:hypothetical protein